MEFIDGAFQYKLENNYCVLTKLIHPDYYLEVPKMVRGKYVCEIGSGAFYRAKDIAAVVIPPTISHIREDAFAESDVSSITRNANKNSPTLYLSKGAFCDCGYLRAVGLGGKVFLEQGGYQFKNCNNLDKIDSLSILGNIPVEAFMNTDIRLFCFNNNVFVSQEAFAGVPLEKIYVKGNLKYASDFLNHRKGLEIICEANSPVSNLAYDGFRIMIKE